MKRSAENDSELPEGWAATALGNVVAPSKEKVEPVERRNATYLSLEHIEQETGNIAGHGTGADVGSTKAVFRAGDVLYGRLRPYLNKVCIPDFDGICSTDILVFPQTAHLEPRYLMRFLMQRHVVQYAHHNSAGVQLPRVAFSKLAELDFPVPPIAEQQRIVAKVEELLGRVGAARERLAKVPALLKRFRQSVLAAACSGQLTAEWRDEHDVSENAAALHKRVLAERFVLWCQAARAKAKADRRTLRSDDWKSRYKPPVDIDLDALADLPSKWRWTSFDTFAATFQYGPRFGENEYADEGVPTLRTTDMTFRGQITLNDPPRVHIPENSRDHFLLKEGDLVVTRTGATIGKCALYEPSIGPAIASAYLIRYRLTCETTLPRYLLEILLSPWGQQQLVGGVTAVAQPNINTKMIARIPIPLPPLAEQREIVRRVEALFALADKLEARVKAATARVEKSTQAILAKAFRGELVPTAAELARQEGRDYEPAAVLLERIRAGGGNAAPAARTRRRSARRRHRGPKSSKEQ